jgi:hypothetical protein
LHVGQIEADTITRRPAYYQVWQLFAVTPRVNGYCRHIAEPFFQFLYRQQPIKFSLQLFGVHFFDSSYYQAIVPVTEGKLNEMQAKNNPQNVVVRTT